MNLQKAGATEVVPETLEASLMLVSHLLLCCCMCPCHASSRR